MDRAREVIQLRCIDVSVRTERLLCNADKRLLSFLITITPMFRTKEEANHTSSAAFAASAAVVVVYQVVAAALIKSHIRAKIILQQFKETRFSSCSLCGFLKQISIPCAAP